MVFHPWQMFEKWGHDTVCQQFEDFMSANELSLFGIVHIVVNPETKAQEKTITMYTRLNDAFAKTYDDLIVAMGASELLSTFDKKDGSYKESKYCSYQLHNTSVSRKKYEIMFKAFFV